MEIIGIIVVLGILTVTIKVFHKLRTTHSDDGLDEVIEKKFKNKQNNENNYLFITSYYGNSL